MKIAYLLGSLNRGGTETLLLDLLIKLKVDRKWTPVLVYRKGGTLENEFLNTETPNYHLSCHNLIGLLLYIVKLRKIVKKEKIDILHAQQPLDAFYAFFASIGLKKKILLSFHGYDYNSHLHTKIILYFIIKITDLNIYVSEELKKHYQTKFALDTNKQIVLYNGINFDKFEKGIETNVRMELNIEKETLLMGMVGSFVSVRNQLLVCRFLKILKNESVVFKFLFIGNATDQQLYAMCVDFCEKNNLMNEVFFLGNREDVPSILSQLDTFIYSTNHDTFGIAVVEAMGAGIPVFVNDSEVMKEITKGGDYAFLYNTEDEVNLYHQFLYYIQNRSLIEMKAKENKSTIRELYSIERHIKMLEAIYSMQISNNKPY